MLLYLSLHFIDHRLTPWLLKSGIDGLVSFNFGDMGP